MDNYETIKARLASLSSFRGNSLTGFWSLGGYHVYSYQTLIAFYNSETGGRWVCPKKYSQTTSKGQKIIRRVWEL
jgi:hypothetical protein